eukprot:scaffold128700_cov19-Tisochrysis_lutea.AAC.1
MEVRNGFECKLMLCSLNPQFLACPQKNAYPLLPLPGLQPIVAASGIPQWHWSPQMAYLCVCVRVYEIRRHMHPGHGGLFTSLCSGLFTLNVNRS